MTSRDASFHGSIPGLYDDYLVPDLRALALDLAAGPPPGAAAGARDGGRHRRVPGRCTRPGCDARYMVTDLNPAMLERARSRQQDDPRLDWQAADATALDLPDGGFDLVLCQFGAMFFPDRVRGCRGAPRAGCGGPVHPQHLGWHRGQRFRPARDGCRRRALPG
ncbi:MAG: class I SAM-dependent methyltransferase [Geminicoccaceae bacterium]